MLSTAECFLEITEFQTKKIRLDIEYKKKKIIFGV